MNCECVVFGVVFQVCLPVQCVYWDLSCGLVQLMVRMEGAGIIDKEVVVCVCFKG